MASLRTFQGHRAMDPRHRSSPPGDHRRGPHQPTLRAQSHFRDARLSRKEAFFLDGLMLPSATARNLTTIRHRAALVGALQPRHQFLYAVRDEREERALYSEQGDRRAREDLAVHEQCDCEDYFPPLGRQGGAQRLARPMGAAQLPTRGVRNRMQTFP